MDPAECERGSDEVQKLRKLICRLTCRLDDQNGWSRGLSWTSQWRSGHHLGHPFNREVESITEECDASGALHSEDEIIRNVPRDDYATAGDLPPNAGGFVMTLPPG